MKDRFDLENAIMNVSHDMSMLALIWNASAVVQFVMALLLVASIAPMVL